MHILLAWRNIWRNPRRTGVILTAVIIGVWSMLVLSSLMRGIMEGMIDDGIATLTGDIQIHHPQYPADPSVINSIDKPQQVDAVLHQVLPPGSRFTSRIRISAVANTARYTYGVSLVGIDPESEKNMSFLASSLDTEHFLSEQAGNGMLIGQALAEHLQTTKGRKIIIMAQDVHGQIASRAFRIQDIYDADMEATEKRFVFIHQDTAQAMLHMDSAVSEFSILLPRHEMASDVAADISAGLSRQSLRVRTWQEALPLLNVYLDLYDGFVFIWFLVVFTAMGFGIVNTTLMAVFERMREFGLLKALGMQPMLIVRTILTESFFLLLCGLVAGNALGLATCYVLSSTGIDLSSLAQGAEFANISRVIYPAVWLKDLVTANLVVLILGMTISLYPAIKAARFQPVQAMHYV
ncbi:MAG: ABC transporter permease [Desulfovermiculus sp.]|nr:ABC transporter permease [Desulfovermiculus sp.]